MSERIFRIVLGGALILFLYSQIDLLVYVYIGLLLFEGLTNWRIPLLVSRLRHGRVDPEATDPGQTCRFSFEAERALRLFVAALLIVTFVLFHEQLWFISWFVGFALLLAGITGICPLAILFKKQGFR